MVFSFFFGDTRANFKRWNICFVMLVALLALALALANGVPHSRFSSGTWDSIYGWIFLIGGASVIYWFVLLVALCSRLGLNTALWLVVGVIGGPVGVAIAHAYVFPKATGYFANGGT